jgi:hypothetical protein
MNRVPGFRAAGATALPPTFASGSDYDTTSDSGAQSAAKRTRSKASTPPAGSAVIGEPLLPGTVVPSDPASPVRQPRTRTPNLTSGFIGEHGLASLGVREGPAVEHLAASKQVTQGRFPQQVIPASVLLDGRVPRYTNIVQRFGDAANARSFVLEADIAQRIGLDQDTFRNILRKAGVETPFVNIEGRALWSKHHLRLVGAIDERGAMGQLIHNARRVRSTPWDGLGNGVADGLHKARGIITSRGSQRLLFGLGVASLPMLGVAAASTIRGGQDPVWTQAIGGTGLALGIAYGTGGWNPRAKAVGGLLALGGALTIGSSVMHEHGRHNDTPNVEAGS